MAAAADVRQVAGLGVELARQSGPKTSQVGSLGFSEATTSDYFVSRLVSDSQNHEYAPGYRWLGHWGCSFLFYISIPIFLLDVYSIY